MSRRDQSAITPLPLIINHHDIIKIPDDMARSSPRQG